MLSHSLQQKIEQNKALQAINDELEKNATENLTYANVVDREKYDLITKLEIMGTEQD